VKPGTLLRLEANMEWHSCYVVDARNNPVSEARMRRDQVAVYLDELLAMYTNRGLQNSCRRFLCLLEDQVVAISASCLRPVQDAE